MDMNDVEAGVEVCWPNGEEVEVGCWPKGVVVDEDVDAGGPKSDGVELATEVEVWPPKNGVPVALLVVVTEGWLKTAGVVVVTEVETEDGSCPELVTGYGIAMPAVPGSVLAVVAVDG